MSRWRTRGLVAIAAAATMAPFAVPTASSAATLPGGTVSAAFGSGALVTISAGGQKLAFVVDTGAASSAITAKAAKALGLAATAPAQPVATIGCQTKVQPTQISGWKLGKIALPTTRVGIINSSLGKASPHGPPLSGLLGSDVLSQFGTVTFDLVHNRLILGGRSLGSRDGIPMTVSRRGSAVAESVRATIGGQRSRFILDTGSPLTVLQTDTAKQAGLVSTHVSLKIHGAAGCGLKAHITQIPEWSTSGTPLPSTVAVTIREPSLRTSPKGPAVGLIGAATLFAFGRLELDFTHDRLALGAPHAGAQGSALRNPFDGAATPQFWSRPARWQ